MAITIKTLIDKNKKAFDSKFFIESLNLSYILINKALKQIVKDEFNIELIDQKVKTSSLVSQIKKELRGAKNTYKTHALQYVQYVHCTVYSITDIISKYKCGKIYLKICHLCTVEL